MPVAASIEQPVASQGHSVLRLDVEEPGFRLEEDTLLTLVLIEVRLDTNVGSGAHLTRVARQRVHSGQLDAAKDEPDDRAAILRLPLVRIALQCPAVAFIAQVGAEAGLEPVAAVQRGDARSVLSVLQASGPGIRAHVAAVSEAPADTHGAGLRTVAATGRHEHAARFTSRTRDDVDHAVDGVDAPERAPRAADDLDPLDVLEHHVLLIPENTGKEWRVDRSPVDEHEQLVGNRVVEAAR